MYNTHTAVWEEPDIEEKELLMGYAAGETATPGVTSDQHSIRRTMDGHTMRWLGAFYPAYGQLHYTPRMQEMIRGEDQIFDPEFFQPQQMARGVIVALHLLKP